MDAKHALTVLNRLAARRPEQAVQLERSFRGRLRQLGETALEVAVESGDAIGKALAISFESEATVEIAYRLMLCCAEDDHSLSVPLREVAFEATRICLEKRRADQRNSDKEYLQELARLSLNLGKALSDLGRREEALEATHKAVEHYRELAYLRPDTFLPDLAMGLNNLGSDLSDLGRQEEALEAVREAIEIRRELMLSRPDVFRSDLATSLNSRGIWLGALGHHEDALSSTGEAVKLFRELARSRLDVFLPDLAMGLNNLGGAPYSATRATGRAPSKQRAKLSSITAC